MSLGKRVNNKRIATTAVLNRPLDLNERNANTALML